LVFYPLKLLSRLIVVKSIVVFAQGLALAPPEAAPGVDGFRLDKVLDLRNIEVLAAECEFDFPRTARNPRGLGDVMLENNSNGQEKSELRPGHNQIGELTSVELESWSSRAEANDDF
jgi:hypothetical protein